MGAACRERDQIDGSACARRRHGCPRTSDPEPVPATHRAAGDLRIASDGDAPSSYAVLLYRTPDATKATVDLTVRSSLGTPEVVACPTTATDWPEVPNQPYDQAPEFNCHAALAFGSLSQDGTTLSFTLDQSSQVEPGVWSLALVAQPGSTSGPFSVDVEQPGPQSLVVTSSAEPEPFRSGPSTPDTSSGRSVDAVLPGGFAAPASEPLTGMAGMAPLAAGEKSALPEATGAEPAAAGTATPATAPLVFARPAAGAAALVSGTGPAAAPAQQDRPRGIGRFAKDRTKAPRPLR